MVEKEFLAERFEQNRDHLRAVAYRMLGSLSEADDAVQEAWLRLSRSDDAAIQNLGGWLTTVVARVCLDMLRSRTSRREEALEVQPSPGATIRSGELNPEQEAVLADSVGLALLVVLDRLTPVERLAFVLHDLFAIPYEEIGPIVGRSPDAARQLASRARRRVQGGDEPAAGLSSRRKVVDSFLAALRAGDLEGIVAVLDPDLVVHVDGAAAAAGRPVEVHGARSWAKGAVTFAQAAQQLRVAMVNGDMALILAPLGKLSRVVRLDWKDDKIGGIQIIAEPATLSQMDVAMPTS